MSYRHATLPAGCDGTSTFRDSVPFDILQLLTLSGYKNYTVNAVFYVAQEPAAIFALLVATCIHVSSILT